MKREARALHQLTTPRLSKTNKYSRRQRGSAVEEQAQEGALGAATAIPWCRLHKEYGTYVDVYILTFGGLRGRSRVGLRGVRRGGRRGRVHAAVRRLGAAARARAALREHTRYSTH